MRNIIKTGIGMLILAIVLIAISALVMRAHAETSGASSTSASSTNPSPAANSEIRPIDAGIVNIVMNGPIDLVLRQAAQPDMVVRGEANMLSRVTTRIEGNTLYIGTRGMFILIRQPLRIEMALPSLEKLQMQGSGDATIKGFRGKQLDVIQRGSGDLQFDGDYQQVMTTLIGSGDLKMTLQNTDSVTLKLAGSGDAIFKGQAKSLTATLSGSGNLDAMGLHANQVALNVSGSSDAKIWAAQEVSARVTGSGDATIYGNPAKRHVERTGSGEISWQ